MKNVSKLLLVACFAMNIGYVEAMTKGIDYLLYKNKTSTSVNLSLSDHTIASCGINPGGTATIPIGRYFGSNMEMQITATDPAGVYKSVTATIPNETGSMNGITKKITITTKKKHLVVTVS
jgi:hypothetical protein